jgi:mercuric reductase
MKEEQLHNVQHFDLVILGSGSTAFAAALRAQELGRNVVMTEERIIGGTCVNRGCLPSKNLIEAARLVHDAAHPRYPGLSATQLDVNFQELIAQKDDVVHQYRHTVEVDDRRLTGDRILIATGSHPVIPDIEGLDQVPYLTSDLLTTDEVMELRERPASLLIIGGGYISLELGQMFHRFGTAVTIVERGSRLLRFGYEPEAGLFIGNIFSDEGIRVITKTEVTSVRLEQGEIVATIQGNGVTQELRTDKLLVATGRRPNTDRIAIESTGVEVNSDGSVVVNEYLQTTVSHIYAAGDVIGSNLDSQMATPVGSQDGALAALNALSGVAPQRLDHRVIPRAIFTDPQIGIVGMTEKQAIAEGHRCWCNTLPISIVPRAGAIRDTKGIIKMVADEETHEVLGVTMIGQNAAEVIHEAAMALRFRATLYDFINMIHVYPTMSEALKIVAISRFKNPENLSCCAT